MFPTPPATRQIVTTLKIHWHVKPLQGPLRVSMHLGSCRVAKWSDPHARIKESRVSHTTRNIQRPDIPQRARKRISLYHLSLSHQWISSLAFARALRLALGLHQRHEDGLHASGEVTEGLMTYSSVVFKLCYSRIIKIGSESPLV